MKIANNIKNRFCYSTLIAFLLLFISSKNNVFADEPDSAYVFAYEVNNGLAFAWSIDQKNWHSIGKEHHFLRSDYGRWGTQKKMQDPFLLHADGEWHCVWSVNHEDGTFAHASSKDLAIWQGQSYPLVMENGNCLSPSVAYNNGTKEYTIIWLSGEHKQAYCTTTKDFKAYTPTTKLTLTSLYKDQRQTATILNQEQTGTVQKVAWSLIENLINTQKLISYNNLLWSESAKTDYERFTDLKPVDVILSVDPGNSKAISDKLIGVFFEDINYAADGGLYAELIQNRDFEYDSEDKEGRDKNWNGYFAWKLNGNTGTFIIDTVSPIHRNNKHYAVLQIDKVGAGLVNEGFDGIAIKAGEKYDFSIFARTPESKEGKLTVRLIGRNGEVYGEAFTKLLSFAWKKQTVVITAKQTVSAARLEIIPQMTGKVQLDMISLFPKKTFMNRKNGLRADLAQVIADMKPKFVRFPGGCVAHGDGIENMYRWENTVGPLEVRKPQRNLWGYHQTAGLGYFEYFQFCEDIGAVPLPIVPAGVPCQNSANHGHPLGGQQGGIPMDKMDEYIQDVLNLIEWANGNVKTKWGKIRAEAGHPKPFNLKYLGVGNEDLISNVFEERFTMIYNAVKDKYPEIEVVGTVGAFKKGGTDYIEGWKIANKLGVPFIDEHYYEPPGWFIHNQDYYDSYDRSKSKVYLGEYAAHLPGRPNNIETALAEALHLLNIERNGDIVAMTSYAPLLAKEGHTQWSPDLIYFNNTEIKPTVGYYVQQAFGQNSGNKYISGRVTLSNLDESVRKRIAHSIVKDETTGDYIIKMVNILPVSVNAKIDLKPFITTSTNARITVLTGKPEDKEAKPQQSVIKIDKDFSYEMSAYSFFVLRFKPNL